MRELERHPLPPTEPQSFPPSTVAIVGHGRLGTALGAALRQTRITVTGPLGREVVPGGVDAVLLCVPDAEIAAAAALVPAGVLVGHCSGATGLEPLRSDDAFSLHPLMTVSGDTDPSAFAGVAAAVDGISPRSLACAHALAVALGMRPVSVRAEDRAAYHAAASIASNFLVTLEAAAERLAATAGIDRADLHALVRATVENWARLGPERALTGPVARGDEATVQAQRAAVAERTPELIGLFDALADATRALASAGSTVA